MLTEVLIFSVGVFAVQFESNTKLSEPFKAAL